MRYLPVGARGVLLELPDSEDAGSALLATEVRLVAERLGIGLEEVVPGAATVLVVAVRADDLRRLLAALPDRQPAGRPASDHDQPVVELAVRYDGPDLPVVAELTGLSPAEVVRRHCAATYRAAFSGFAPGFAYLVGLDPALQVPRRSTPRAAVPAGSVAVADAYTAVYPRASPGGWHLLGTVGTAMFDLARSPAALLSPGTRVRFVEAR